MQQRGIVGSRVPIVVYLWKEVALAFRHVDEAPRGVDTVSDAMMLFGKGGAKHISEPQTSKFS